MAEKISKTEVIVLEEEIKVCGLGLQNSGLPISFQSLGKLWELFGEKLRGKVSDFASPYTEYAVCKNLVPDYIAGYGVQSEASGLEFFVIPKGKYIKDTFSAESFEELVNEVLPKRSIKKYVKEHKLKINKEFSIEVYPRSEFDKDNFCMYSLTPIAPD